MQLRLIAVGKIRESYLQELATDFRKRLRPFYHLEEIEIKPADGSDPANAIESEGERIAKHIAPNDQVWLLERRGSALTSETLAERVAAVQDSGVSRFTLIVAGTYGASKSLMGRADFLWSLSTLTFLHEWARVIVLEQLYRAAKINRNEPYHH